MRDQPGGDASRSGADRAGAGLAHADRVADPASTTPAGPGRVSDPASPPAVAGPARAAPAGPQPEDTVAAADESAPHPGAVLALLADPSRLRCLAAVVLGATTVPAVAAATGLADKATRRAVQRLVGGGLLTEDADGELGVVEDRFGQAARLASGLRPAITPEDVGAGPPHVAVLRGFLVDGRLASIPAHRGKRRVVLDFLAQRFEPGQVYPERDVNAILGRFHPDYAALRRYLVDEDFLERREGFYWRTGGTFDTG